jgi:acyl carrier protein
MQELINTLKVQIVEQLNIEHVKAEDIGDETPLFAEGLGLDSIDALELIVLLQQKYGIKLADASEGPKVFYSVKTIAEYITATQKK